MNRGINPFGGQQSDNINIDKLAQEMILTLKKLKNVQQKVSGTEKQDISDNSHGSLPIKGTNFDKNQIEGIKRQNPVKVIAIPRKRHKTSSEYQGNNDDSQFIDSVSNRKITQFFTKRQKQLHQSQKSQKQQLKNQSSQQQDSLQNKKIQQEQEQLQIQQNNPVVRNLKQKISKKQKNIQQLAIQVQRIREKYQKFQQEMEIKKQNQMNVMIEILEKRYAEKIYMYKLKKIRKEKDKHQCRVQRMIYEDIVEKIQILKNQKNNKKSGKGKSLMDQANFLDIYGEERQNYLNVWKKKLESEKSAVEKQMTRTHFCSEMEYVQEEYLDLPSVFLTKNQTRIIFQKCYFPLYCRHQCQLYQQIRTLNLQKLCYENTLLLPYPKLMPKQRRIQLKIHLKDIFTRSQPLTCQQTPYSLFTSNTKLTQLQKSAIEYIVLSRSIFEQQQTITNLKNILKRYEYLSQSVAKYIIKTIIRAHDRIRKEINYQAIILPENVIFNQRNDLKIDNWIFNQVYRFPQFGNYLLREGKYLYFPPEYKIAMYKEDTKGQSMAIWTIGIMLYEMVFGKKPFPNRKDVDHYQFYIYNQLQFPAKPQIMQNCKQFIKQCLCQPKDRITFDRALKHPFFQSKK